MRSSLFYTIIFGLLFVSCNRVDENGYSTADSGLKYKLYTIGDGEKKPEKENVVLAHVVLKSPGDTVLYNSKWKHSGGVAEFNFSDTKGLNECLSYLNSGDSASFIFAVSNAEKELLSNIDYQHERIKADIKVHDVFTSKQYDDWKEEMSWLYDKEMNEQIALNQYLDSIGVGESNYIAGIYYQELDRGRGKRPVKGNAVVVQYKAYFLNGKRV